MESRPGWTHREPLTTGSNVQRQFPVTRHGPRRCTGLVAALILGFGLTACGNGNTQETGTDADPRAERTTPVAAVEIQPRDLSRQISLSGTVQPRNHIRLAGRTSGTVDAVHVEEGDTVERGALLAELDMSEPRAELARAQAIRAEAELEYRRAAQLRGDRVISAAEYQRAQAALEVADSEVRLWQTRVDFGRITAPMDAVITARHVDPGEAVQAHETLFELAVMDALVIRMGVSELDVAHLRTGRSVPVRVDALPELEIDGRLRRIFPMADSVSRLITVEVALPASAAGNGVRPGYLARVRLNVDERPDAIAVPSAALGEDGDTRYVYVIRDERLHRREVEPGVTRGPWTEIVSGLDPGEIVLATHPIDMRDGQRVRIVGWRG
jgi:membrane fusion protein, multidrug efflux system